MSIAANVSLEIIDKFNIIWFKKAFWDGAIFLESSRLIETLENIAILGIKNVLSLDDNFLKKKQNWKISSSY